jgi:excisionase family DNA binding protein
MNARALLGTKEVADYLRLKERKIYDLVARGAIPHSRVSGKLLFPRALIDEWVRAATTDTTNRMASRVQRSAPAVVAGSSDPLLEWAIKESGSGLASLALGSVDGIERLVEGQACAAAIHWPSPTARGHRPGERNAAIVQDRLSHLDCVLLEWAKREQGLVVARGNRLGITGVADLRRRNVRTVLRQSSAGSHLLLLQLLAETGLTPDALHVTGAPAHSESDLAARILDGDADAGLAVRSVARQFHLDFIPLAVERLDVAVFRGSFFDAPWQRLMDFARTRAFANYAKSLAGYDVAKLGMVHWNA